MNREISPLNSRDDFNTPPDRDFVALFAVAGPPERSVDITTLLPQVTSEFSRSRTVFRWSNPMFRRIAAVVSATAGVFAVVALSLLLNSGAQTSFADVVDRVAKTQSVTFKQTVTIPGKPAETLRMAVLANGLSRMDMPNGNYTIMDLKSGNSIFVSPKERKASVMIGLYVPEFNVYEILRNVVNEKSVRLPDDVIDRRKVSVFRVEPGEKLRKQARGPIPPMKVWVDPQTHLPIRMEAVQQNDKESAVIHDFSFDEPLDPSLFSMNPPQGYTVTTQGYASLGTPAAQPDLLTPEVIPGVGLGPVKFGMTKDEVIKLLGKPDVDGKANLDYPSRGYGFMISPQRGVVGISCYSQQMAAFKVRDFAGKTKEGIGIGSSLADLEKSFGRPDSAKSYGPTGAHAASVVYGKLGLNMTLWSGKVVAFMMLSPRR